MSKGGPGGLEVTGPLASFEVGFRAELERMGYSCGRRAALCKRWHG